MKTYIVYIPGLGDHYDGFRARALKHWALWGVTTLHVPITWYDGGSMESKMLLISSAINTVPKNSRIVLIGESAGGTLALHTGQSNKRVDGVITLCGVAQSFTPVSNYLRRRAPALDQAVNTLPEDFNVPVHSIRAWVDGVVGKKYSRTKRASQHVIWSVGHIITIALCLTIFAPIVCRIAKTIK